MTEPEQPPAVPTATDLPDPGAPVIPGYQLLERVGRGGFSAVYRARQPAYDRDVAVKVLHIDLADEASRARFARECSSMGRLTGHANIATLLDAGTTADGSAYLTTPFAPEGSFGDLVRTRGPLSVPEVVRVGIAVADALGAAHDVGILHRDVKPDNVLRSAYGEPVLTDFGVAAALAADGAAATAATRAFTTTHAAPELLDAGKASVASDLYGLGSTLWTLLEGTAPFRPGPDEGLVAFAVRLQRQAVPALTRDDVPPALEALLVAAMAKSPADRPASAAELAASLRSLAVETPTAGAPTASGATGRWRRPPPVGSDVDRAVPPPTVVAGASALEPTQAATTAAAAPTTQAAATEVAATEVAATQGVPTVLAPAVPDPPPTIGRPVAGEPPGAPPPGPEPTSWRGPVVGVVIGLVAVVALLAGAATWQRSRTDEAAPTTTVAPTTTEVPPTTAAPTTEAPTIDAPAPTTPPTPAPTAPPSTPPPTTAPGPETDVGEVVVPDDAPGEVRRAARDAQRVATALADGDWDDVRRRVPSLEDRSDDDLAEAWGGLDRSTLVVTDWRTGDGRDAEVVLRLGQIAHETVGGQRRTNLYCASWTVDGADVVAMADPQQVGPTPWAGDRWVDPSEVTGAVIADCTPLG